VYSAPATPLVSFQPKGKAMQSNGFAMMVRGPPADSLGKEETSKLSLETQSVFLQFEVYLCSVMRPKATG